MTNSEAQAYAVLALKDLMARNIITAKDELQALRALESEMHYLFDMLSEYEATEKANHLFFYR